MIRSRHLFVVLFAAAVSAAATSCGSDEESSPGATDGSDAAADANSIGSSDGSDGAVQPGDASDATTSEADAGADAGPDAIAAIDLTFGTSGVAMTAIQHGSDDLRGLARQADGKVLAIGRGAAHGDLVLFRFTTAGALDTTFNGVGAVSRPLTSGFGYAVAVQSDGHIVTLSATSDGSSSSVHRFTAAGVPDATFGTLGRVQLSGRPGGLVVQGDDKILVATGTYVGARPLEVSRLSAAGASDGTFGVGGKAEAWTDAESMGLALDSQGRVIALAELSSSLAVARFTTGGMLDGSFGGTGTVALNLTKQAGNWSRPLAVQADDKILVGGRGIDAPVASTAVVARLDSAGALDTTFDSDGYAATPVGGEFAGLAVDGAARIVVLRASLDTDYFFRFDPSGAPDVSFGTGGVFSTSTQSRATSLLVQSGNELVSGGSIARDPDALDVRLTRVTSSGALDTTWATNGHARANANDSLDYVRAIAPTAGGFYAAGLAGLNSALGEAFGVAKYTSIGALDATFGDGGRVVIRHDKASAFGIAVDSMGRVVVGGGQSFSVARLDTNGTLDTTFSGTGKRSVGVLSGAGYNAAFAMVVDSSDRPILAGTSSTSAGRFGAIVRLKTNGENDETFSGDGVVTNDAQGSYNAICALELQPDGKIIAAGGRASTTSAKGIYLARYATDGTLDPTFTVTSTTNDFVLARAIARQSDGKVLVAGYEVPDGWLLSVFDFSRYTVLAGSRMIVRRYEANGTIDATFATGGTLATNLASGGCSTPQAYAIRAAETGGAYVAGMCSTASGRRGFVARVTAGGAIDTAFGSNGVYLTAIGSDESGIYSLAVQPNGALLAGGFGYRSPTGNDFALLRFQ